MTQQVRTTYRRHRTAAWAVALVLTAAVAAVAIPFATGASGKTLQFVDQPANPWQKNTTLTTPFSVAVFSGGSNPLNSGPPPTPTITAAGAGDSSDFSFGSPTYNSTTKKWSWPDAKPNTSADSGLYTFTVTLGTLTATSATFRVADFVCPGGQTNCAAQSNSDPTAEGAGRFNINNSLANAVALDFSPGGTDPNTCSPWNRAFYTDASNNTVYFPAVTLNFNWGSNMLQVQYLIRNTEWVQTSTSRGNNDIEFCAQARHQNAALNNGLHPFSGKYGDATWDGTYYNGVLNTVSNSSKVKSDPVVCGRGTVDLPTGVGGASETWRVWTICIPYDWDWGIKGG